MTQLPDDRELDMLAADYVMGLLDSVAEAAADERLETDESFQRAVNGWRKRLGDFDISAPPVTPTAQLWQRIVQSTKADRAAVVPAGMRGATRGATLWHNLRFWRVTGLIGTAAALIFAFIAIGSITTSKHLRRDLVALAQRKPVYVAVLVSDATREVGAVVNAFANGRVELIPLKTIDVPQGRTLQVWTLWDRAVGPKPVGLTGQSRAIDLNLDELPETVANQLFEITLEPEGGSPTGRPTGPILFKGNTAKVL